MGTTRSTIPGGVGHPIVPSSSPSSPPPPYRLPGQPRRLHSLGPRNNEQCWMICLDGRVGAEQHPCQPRATANPSFLSPPVRPLPKGYLACLRYAHENGCPWDGETCAAAAAGALNHMQPLSCTFGGIRYVLLASYPSGSLSVPPPPALTTPALAPHLRSEGKGAT